VTTDARSGVRLTMPLFKLLPGLPRRSFSSLTAFLGGIFLLLLFAYARSGVVEKKRTGEEKARKVVGHSSAVLAAGCGRRGIKEKKQTRRALVGLDVVEGKEEMTAGVSPLWMVPSKVGHRLVLPG
jgi:hypothetical protein